MLYIVAAVLIVLLLMNLFMLLILRQMTAQTGRQVEKDAGRLFGLYDALLKKKSEELKTLSGEEARLLTQMEEKKAALKALGNRESRPVVPQRELIVPAYQDRSFSDTYKKVKERFTGFAFTKDQIIADLHNNPPKISEEAENWGNGMRELREALTFEVIYRLSLLTQPEQMKVLGSSLAGNAALYFLKWEDDHPGEDIMQLSMYLDERLSEMNDQIVVRTAADDPTITEGARFLYRNKLYDYSI